MVSGEPYGNSLPQGKYFALYLVKLTAFGAVLGLLSGWLTGLAIKGSRLI